MIVCITKSINKSIKIPFQKINLAMSKNRQKRRFASQQTGSERSDCRRFRLVLRAFYRFCVNDLLAKLPFGSRFSNNTANRSIAPRAFSSSTTLLLNLPRNRTICDSSGEKAKLKILPSLKSITGGRRRGAVNRLPPDVRAAVRRREKINAAPVRRP